jgi:acetylornithine aminotransferase/acetylornithine/N-succinyldiaminopimelate aminotransferase
MIDDELLEHVREHGARLAELLAGLPGVIAVRGRGLLLAAELEREAGEVVDACLERGLLVGTAGDQALRITPPLTIEAHELDRAVAILQEVLT